MADAARLKKPIIRAEVADQLVISCLVVIALTQFHDDDHLAQPVGLLKLALPLASQSERMQRMRPVAEDIVAAAPHWRTRTTGNPWDRAHRVLQSVLLGDALTRTFALAGL